MTTSTDPSALTPDKQALVALRKLRARVTELEQQRREPIAIVGIGCRFPDANGPDAFWELLARGGDAVREVPPSRWDPHEYFDADRDAPGKTYSKWAALLNDVDRFDAPFFNISQREAVRMDPQHRLFLEVAWEALEDGAIAPLSLRGSNTSVFAGVTCVDYLQLHTRDLPRASIDAYLLTNNTLNMTAARVSFLLGLQGPSMAIDTACSSSLVAIDRACRSLRERESDLSIAGGVHLALLPEAFVSMSKWGMLSADGRCKTFAEGADGFVRGEGCGVVVLKRLSDALANGDLIHAVIRGTAVNQDGASSALPVPNGPAQEAVIRAALLNSALEARDIGYLEAHGTGTALGDPIEVEALGAVFAPGRDPAQPLVIGSVKTNFGHLEAAAGVAGLLKVVLALRHATIPPHLHCAQRSSHIDWTTLPFEIPSSGMHWHPRNGKRRAGVSSFGFSGTNAHVVLEEAPLRTTTESAAADRPLHWLSISARSEPALRELAERYAERLPREPTVGFADVCHTAAVGRSHFKHRVSVVAADAATASERLRAYLAHRPMAGVRAGHALHGAPKLAFLFTGQGAQYVGMARQLYDTSPVFKASLDRCAAAFRAHLREPLLDVVYPDAARRGLLDRTEFTQPALFAIELALAELWRSWGIEPTFVLGHSLGEYVAACVAGVLDVEDAVALVSARARLMQALPAGGRMSVVRAPASRVREAIKAYPHSVAIAAINSPVNTVISGAAADVDAVVAALSADGLQCTPLTVSHAFHSPLMEPMLEEFGRELSRVSLAAPTIRLVSNLDGRVVADEVTAPSYWQKHLREPVQFAASIRTLVDLGCKTFIEIGPSPVLSGMGSQCVADAEWLPSLRPGQDAWTVLLESAQALYAAGHDIDWHGFDRPYPRRRVALPTYAFQRTRCWLETAPAQPERAAFASSSQSVRPLLGERLDSNVPLFRRELRASAWPFLAQHRMRGVAVASAPVFLEFALAAAREAFSIDADELVDAAIHEPLTFAGDESRIVETALRRTGDAVAVEISSRGVNGHSWTRHASVIARASVASGDAPRVALAEIRTRCATAVSGDEFYTVLAARGLDFGPAVRGIRKIWRGDGEALGHIELPTATDTFILHPALLDACLHVLAAAARDGLAADTDIHVLVGVERLRMRAPLAGVLHAHARLEATAAPERRGSLIVTDDAGRVVVEADGLRLRRLASAALGPDNQSSLFYALEWQPQPIARLDGNETGGFPAPSVLAEAAERILAAVAKEHDVEANAELLRVLRARSVEFAVDALRELGIAPGKGAVGSAESVVVPAQRRLFRRLLEIAADATVVADAPAPATRTASELVLLERCGPRLGDVLRGRCDPLQLLFPGGASRELDSIYRDSPSARIYNALLRRAVGAALATAPRGRRIRILEIGAGTGGTTAELLSELPDTVEYVFTDISPSLVARAGERFSAHPNFSTRVLDIERRPAEQGFEERDFDIVIAANCLHATADLRRTLANVRDLLVPGGPLLLLEGTAPETWIDLTFGMTAGWWRFADPQLRASHPLLSRDAWLTLLGEMGFDGPAGVEHSEFPDPTHQALLIARAPTVRVERGGDLPGRSWLVFSDDQGVGAALAASLAARGDRFELIEPRALRAAAGERRAAVEATFAAAASRLGPIDEVAYLGALDVATDRQLDASALARGEEIAAALPLAVMQIVAGKSPRPRLWLATAGSQAVGDAHDRSSAAQAPLWGLARVFALEHPDVEGAVIDFDPEAPAAAVAGALLDEVIAPDGEDQIAYREGRRYVARIRAAARPPDRSFSLDAAGAYVVTGGWGGLGLKIATWLAANGARVLVLLGRRPPDTRKGDSSVSVALDAIERLGARVLLLACDVADRAQVDRVFTRFGRDLPPLKGIVHAAVDLSAAPLVELDAGRLHSMMRAKVLGTWNLHEATYALELDWFITFSSTTALLGAKGLAHYAAANQFLDAFARHRAATGRRSVNVNWGTWDVMRLASQSEQQSYAQGGLRPLASADALDALARICASGATIAVVADVDWNALRRVYEARRRRPLLNDLAATPQAETPQLATGASEWLEQLRHSDREQARELLMEHVRQTVADTLRAESAASIGVAEGFFQMGMDSLMTVELRNRLERSLGLKLPPTLAFEFSTVESLATLLCGQLELGPAEPTGGPPPANAVPGAPVAELNDLDKLGDDELASMLDRQVGLLLGNEAKPR